MKKRKEDDKSNIVFVGGLRKSTTEDCSDRVARTRHVFRNAPASLVTSKDKVAGHFSKFGQVDSAVASRGLVFYACEISLCDASGRHQKATRRHISRVCLRQVCRGRGSRFKKARGFQVDNCLLGRLNPLQRSWRPRVATCHLDVASHACFTHSISSSDRTL